MNPTYYSLHIGVNKYHPDCNVPHLGGCAQDVSDLVAVLSEIIPTKQLQSKVLLDDEATYQNIIDHFGEKHLLKAGPDDVVLIQYSGHGAREKSAPEFYEHFPDGYNETLVCYDSRISGGRDLADKELAVLVDRIASNGTHVVVIFDCCHSGSGLRDLKMVKRQFLAKNQSRPYEDYLDGFFANKYPNGKGLSIPVSKHILLAACKKTEPAMEIGGQGFFTTNLIEAIKEPNTYLSYSNLFTTCTLKMSQRIKTQHPQFEPSGFFNSHESFLKLQTKPNEVFLKMTNMGSDWEIKYGAIHGLPTAQNKHAIFEIVEDGNTLGYATSQDVKMDSCFVDLNFEAEKGKVYNARLISMPEETVFFQLEADAAGEARIRTALEKKEMPIFFGLEKDVQSSIRVEASASDIKIIRKEDNKLVRHVEGDFDEAVFADVFSVLNEIAQWEKLLHIDHEETTLKRDNVQMVLRLLDDNGETVKKLIGDEIYLGLKNNADKAEPLKFQIDIYNRDVANELHVALFYFSEDFEIHPFFKDVIPPNSLAKAIDKNAKGKFYDFNLGGNTESTDYFKLFVSTKQVSTYLLEKNKTFKIGEKKSYSKTRSTDKSVTERAIGGMREKLDEEIFIDDWYTKKMMVYSVLSDSSEIEFISNKDDDEMAALMEFKEERSSSSSSAASNMPDLRTAPDEGVIKILPHSSLNPTIQVSPIAKTKSANAADDAFIAILDRPENQTEQLINLTGLTRSSNPHPILEITGLDNKEKLKKEPLQIQLNSDSDGGVVAFTFDGEHIVPTGISSKDENGNDIVTISEVPDGNTRNIGRALKFCFFKIVLGREEVYQLRWVDYDSGKSRRKTKGLYDEVEKATNILICVHGIIGDTNVMAEQIRSTVDQNVFDLVLTFDYENLNTPIQKTARQFKESLNDVGIKAGSGKNVTILAHSMGGLVSRCMIEQLDGKNFISKLIMAGTPNAGSNASKMVDYRNLATTLFTLAANTGFGIPAAASVLGVLQYSEKLTVTLEQMHTEKSEFLKSLNQSADPEIPYYIIAGNFEAFVKDNPDKKGFLDKALKFGANFLYDELNDIAVSLESITHIQNGRKPIPEIIRVSGHHMNYFTYPPCIDKITTWLKENK